MATKMQVSVLVLTPGGSWMWGCVDPPGKPCKPSLAPAEGLLAPWSQTGALLPRAGGEANSAPPLFLLVPFLASDFSCFLDSDGNSARKGISQMSIWV